MARQDVEKVRQLCSRIAQRLNVPKRVRLPSSLAAAALDGLFEHPEGFLDPLGDIRVLVRGNHNGCSTAC